MSSAIAERDEQRFRPALCPPNVRRKKSPLHSRDGLRGVISVHVS